MLFALWSITAFVAEVPTGALADRWSRRGSLILAGCLQAAAFAVWTGAPGFGAFAVGFVVWGIGGALMSGASEALVYDGLAAVAAPTVYVRVHGWMTSAELLVQVPTALLASGLFAARRLPARGLGERRLLPGRRAARRCASRRRPARRTTRTPPARCGRASPPRCAVRACCCSCWPWRSSAAWTRVEEYFPVLAADRGVPVTAVPVAILVIALAGAAGAALGGRAGRLPDRALPALLVVAAALLGLARRPPDGGVARRRGAVLRDLPRRARGRRGAAAGPHHRPLPRDPHLGGGRGHRNGGAAGVRGLGGRWRGRGRRRSSLAVVPLAAAGLRSRT